MTPEQIQRFRETIADFRRRAANVKRGEVESLLLSMGWDFKPKRGGEPRYDKPGRYPIALPNHRMLNKFTLGGILDRLEEDLDREEGIK